jgi:hypothetical protein
MIDPKLEDALGRLAEANQTIARLRRLVERVAEDNRSPLLAADAAKLRADVAAEVQGSSTTPD